MTNGALIRLVLAGMIGVSVLFGAKEAKATPVTWDQVTNVVRNAKSYGYPSTDYSSGSVTFSDGLGGATINSNPKFSMIYYANFGTAGYRAVGGLDGVGTTASGFMNANKPAPGAIRGLITGQTANYPFADDGYWLMFVDVNGDGNYGTYDPAIGLFDYDEGEMTNDARVSNFQGFQTDAGTLSAGDISGWYTVPEVPTGVLTALGLSAFAFQNGTNVIHFQIAVTNLTSFRVEYRENLTNTAWSNLGTYSATGAITVVTDTNTVPLRFYRVVSP